MSTTADQPSQATGAYAKPSVLEEVRPASMPRRPIIENERNFAWITQKVCGIVEGKTPTWWWVAFTISATVASFTLMGLIYQVSTGNGVWG